MAHQCVHCKRILPKATKELFEGCADCGRKFFYFIRDEQLQKLKEAPPIEIPEDKKEEVEQDIREMAGITDEEAPVILDFESVRATGEGKFEIDLANVFSKDRPVVYKMEEGKYIIDLASTLNKGVADLKEIKDPENKD
jgi:predicted  nucleic acid-binding Zn-ribbon protein